MGVRNGEGSGRHRDLLSSVEVRPEVGLACEEGLARRLRRFLRHHRRSLQHALRVAEVEVSRHSAKQSQCLMDLSSVIAQVSMPKAMAAVEKGKAQNNSVLSAASAAGNFCSI